MSRPVRRMPIETEATGVGDVSVDPESEQAGPSSVPMYGDSAAGGIRVESLSKTYQDRVRGQQIEALTDLSFSIGRGQFVAVVGPSGCGKTTLLKILAGLVSPSDGSISVGSSEIHGPDQSMGVVFQEPTLLPWRTVLSNLMVPVTVLGLKPREAYLDRARSLLDLVGLEDFARRYPFELSGGMQQRVALCRGLIHDPPVLLLDEPFGALDALTREELNFALLDIWEQTQKTICLVTHDIREAVLMADRILILSSRPGYIVADIRIDLARPRSIETMADQAFGKLAVHVRSFLTSRKRE